MSVKRERQLEVLRSPAGGVPAEDALAQRNDEPSLADYLDVVAEGRWLVALAVALALGGAIAYVLLATPIFRSDAVVQVEDAKGLNSFLADLAVPMGEGSKADTEIEVLRSRTLVGNVVRELRLDIVAEPRRFPLLGAAVARRRGEAQVAGPFLSAAYGWGGERIKVDRLEVPPPLLGERLTLVSGEGGRYQLRGPSGEKVVDGVVGEVASGAGVSIFVSDLRARPGLEFVVRRRRLLDVIEDLQRDIRIAERGKKTGIVRLSLDGPSPEAIAAILDSLSHAYLRQNVERRSAEAEKTLEFLQGQLPVLRKDVDAAEAELEAYRTRRGSIDVTLETQGAVARSVDIEKALAELRVEAAALRGRFTEEHPILAAASAKIRRLEAERKSLEGQMKKLPESELESAKRLRDVKVANELYLTVLGKAQELRVVKEGTIGNVRIVDAAAVPFEPVSPRPALTAVLGLVIGLVGGICGAFVRRALANGVDDPEEVERSTSVPVSASVPRSTFQMEAERRAHGDRALVKLLAADDPKDLAVESLRSLRTSLQFALHEARNQIVAIGGPAPGVGKSFVTANLAHLLGEAGRRVLVIDADMRRGQLHNHFGLERGAGLSDVLLGETSIGDAIRTTPSPNVSALTTGQIPPNPAELLGSERFQRLLGDVAARFDVVMVDTPPVLAVTDAALIARHAGVTMLVIRAGKHPMREIQASLRQLARNGVRVHGIVVNDVKLDRGLGRRSTYHYQYRYD